MGTKRKPSDGGAADEGVGQSREEAGPSVDNTPSIDNLDDESRESYFANLYAKPPDFLKLALRDPDFAAVTKGRELDFDDPASVMQLTKTLLKLDFGLKLELPEDRLCPPVPNRHSYILWIKDLVNCTPDGRPDRPVVGVDIGTGASCIYPLLGCVQCPNWTFLATDIDDKNLEYARRNVKLNNLERRIHIFRGRPDHIQPPIELYAFKPRAFVMMNPPFYESEDQMVSNAAQKSRPPFTACTGAKVEMVTEGGEVAYVEHLITATNISMYEDIQWYSSMLGHLSSVTRVVEKIKAKGISNYAVTDLAQGNKTRRWIVAWSGMGIRPPQSIARGTKSLPKHLLPPATEVEITSMPLPEKIRDFADGLHDAISSLETLTWEWDKERLEGTGRTKDNVWSRAYRRRKKRGYDTRIQDPQGPLVDPHLLFFGFKLCIRVGRDRLTVTCRWLEGHDEKIFESFQGFLKSTVKSLLPEGKKSSGNDG